MIETKEEKGVMVVEVMIDDEEEKERDGDEKSEFEEVVIGID